MDGNGRWIVINAANGIELEQGRVTESSTEGMITMAMQIVAADAKEMVKFIFVTVRPPGTWCPLVTLTIPLAQPFSMPPTSRSSFQDKYHQDHDNGRLRKFQTFQSIVPLLLKKISIAFISLSFPLHNALSLNSPMKNATSSFRGIGRVSSRRRRPPSATSM